MKKKEKYYVVEVNKGIYLYKSRDARYYFTDDVMNASKYLDAKEAGDVARKSGGKALYYTITHEVID
ncbi:hypothetical protein JGU41_12805 [Staphylococcus aureus]|uniref:hypothetical protein n=1 Tax=Staphylococcus aureus TaxID=1280 RepID=UPI0018ECC8B3|nr:hypothetical protein [Staphylococcus aureus]MBJ6291812.1 hypothetical protein [Staphylococcus aureus]